MTGGFDKLLPVEKMAQCAYLTIWHLSIKGPNSMFFHNFSPTSELIEVGLTTPHPLLAWNCSSGWTGLFLNYFFMLHRVQKICNISGRVPC